VSTRRGRRRRPDRPEHRTPVLTRINSAALAAGELAI
jgi:hypothetical protein